MRSRGHPAGKFTLAAAVIVIVAFLPAAPAAAAPAAATPAAAGSTTHVPVLMYHRIAIEPPVDSRFPGLYVTPVAFDSELSDLKAMGWHTITAAELGDDIVEGRAVPARTFVITIDDGHVDGYTGAWPIMQKYGFVGTFFVVTGHVGLAGFLTWDMAAELAQAGNEIANHTVDHVSLPSYHGAALADQIDGAASTIETQLALRGMTTTVRTFAYPYGHTSPEATQLLASRGYTLAVTTVFETDSVPISEPLLYPRVRVSRGETVRTFIPSVKDASAIAWRGQLAMPSASPRSSPTSPEPDSLSNPSPSDGPLVAALPTSPVTPDGDDPPAPTVGPVHEPAVPEQGAQTAALLAAGALGILTVLLFTSVVLLRRRRR